MWHRHIEKGHRELPRRSATVCDGLRPPGFQLSLLGADSLHSEAISDTMLTLTLRGPGAAGSILSNEWELEL